MSTLCENDSFFDNIKETYFIYDGATGHFGDYNLFRGPSFARNNYLDLLWDPEKGIIIAHWYENEYKHVLFEGKVNDIHHWQHLKQMTENYRISICKKLGIDSDLKNLSD